MSELIKNALAATTFGCLKRPAASWVLGDVALIDDPGSFGEEGSFFFGAARAIDRLRACVVEHLENHVEGRIVGVGQWICGARSALMVMALCAGDEVTIPSAKFEEWLHTTRSECGPDAVVWDSCNHLMDASSDGFWAVAQAASDETDPDGRRDLMGLAFRLLPDKSHDALSGGPLGRTLLQWRAEQQALADRHLLRDAAAPTPHPTRAPRSM